MADEAALAAAAGVVDDIIGDQQIRPDTSDLMGIYPDAAAAPAEPGEQSAPEPELESIPSWEADTSGIEDLLDEDEPPVGGEPDFFQQAPPPAAVEETWEDDEEKRQLKAQLVAAQKRLAWEQEQRTRAQEKEWRAEAGRRFPLSDPEEITATSRRAFLRKAAEQHQRVQKKVAPLTAALEQLKQQTIQEARQEAREEARASWGRPTAGPTPAQVQVAGDEAQYDRRAHRSAHDLIKAKLLGGKYGAI